MQHEKKVERKSISFNLKASNITKQAQIHNAQCTDQDQIDKIKQNRENQINLISF